jgi:hypothetical protein
MPQLQPSVGLASAIIQALDFADKVLSPHHTILDQGAAKGASSPGNHAVLQNVANNLYRLITGIPKADKKAGKIGGNALSSLLNQGESARIWIGYMIDYVLQAQAKLNYGEQPNFSTVREALITVKKDKDLVNLKDFLKTLRNQVDTSLLATLR